MRLRFLPSHFRKISVRDKVIIGEKRISLGRNTLHRVWAVGEGENGPRDWGCQLL